MPLPPRQAALNGGTTWSSCCTPTTRGAAARRKDVSQWGGGGGSVWGINGRSERLVLIVARIKIRNESSPASKHAFRSMHAATALLLHLRSARKRVSMGS